MSDREYFCGAIDERTGEIFFATVLDAPGFEAAVKKTREKCYDLLGHWQFRITGVNEQPKLRELGERMTRAGERMREAAAPEVSVNTRGHGC